MSKALAYKGDKELKDKFIKELEWHAKQDAFLQGTYGKGQGDNFRGCAVGCGVNSLNRINGTNLDTDSHKAYEDMLGIPETLAHLEDRIFEGLPAKDAKKWPLQFANAIPVGADLSMVVPKFMVWLMKDLEKYTQPRSDQRRALQRVRKLYKRRIAGEEVSDQEFADAADAAYAAADAAYAADAAAYAAADAAYAAYAAAYAAARTAAAAAYAAYAAAYAAARTAADAAYAAYAAYTKMAKKLLQLLNKAPVS